MGRKDKNIGAQLMSGIDAITSAEQTISVVMVERVLYALLKGEYDRLAADVTLLRKYLSHLFDPVLGAKEREEFLQHFLTNPPRIVLGYPKGTGTSDMPCISIVLEGESEAQTSLGGYLGDTPSGEGGDYAEYVGAPWTSTYGVVIYATHPDGCAYLYQITKMIIVAAKVAIEQAGFRNISLAGTELQPMPELEPEYVFARTLRVTGEATVSVPQFMRDPARFRVSVHACDTVIDGLQGGVHVTGVVGG